MVDRSPDHTTADRLLSLPFVGLGLSSLCYYFALALTTTVLPIYVVDHLDGGGRAPKRSQASGVVADKYYRSYGLFVKRRPGRRRVI